MQWPPEQSIAQVDPLGQEMLQPPAEQSTSQLVPPQYVRHPPEEQSRLQDERASQAQAQRPPEQPVEQLLSEAGQVVWQPPLEQLQLPLEQSMTRRWSPGVGSGTKGEPPEHAARASTASARPLIRPARSRRSLRR
jgi:hypothetical protein